MDEQKKVITEIIKHASYEIVPKTDDLNKAAQFIGTPKKHSADPGKILLLTDPFSDTDIIYDFSIKDILQVEELDTVSAEDGRSAIKIKIWVKKGAMGLQTKPFIV